VLVAAGALNGWPRKWLAAGLALIVLAMLIGAGMGMPGEAVQEEQRCAPLAAPVQAVQA